MDKSKVTIAISFLLVGGYVLFEIATRFAEAGMVGGRPENNAALFPALTAILLLFVTLIWIVQNVRAKATGDSEAGSPVSSESTTPNLRSLWILLILVVYIVFVNIVGYLALTPIALTAMFYVLGVKHLLKGLGLSLITTFVFYYLFGGLMNIILPVGRFGWYI